MNAWDCKVSQNCRVLHDVVWGMYGEGLGMLGVMLGVPLTGTESEIKERRHL